MLEEMRSATHPAYAHSIKPPAPWETLPDHLHQVGIETSTRAAKFGCVSLGLSLGQLHDFGKFKEAFQSYLHGKKVEGKGHSSAGALYARKHFGRLGVMIAHAIAGHHAGLKDNLLAKDGRLDRDSDDLDLALAGFAIRPSGFVLPNAPEVPAGFKADGSGLGGFQSAFLIRMLFSCLVDADRICTERFYAKHDGRKIERGPLASMASLAAALTAWMVEKGQEREARGDDSREVNKRREKILADVRLHAADPPGVFTLTVPTGGGKTLTGLDFALRHAARHGLDRVIVVIPFTSVIEQTAAVYREALGEWADEVLEHHSAFDEATLRGEDRQGLAKLQLSMENWDARIVVTTAVQFFESLFSDRPSRCRKLHNIARSVVILDEAQTIPLHLLRPCVAALKELAQNYGTSIVLSTATQPALIDHGRDAAHSFPGGFRASEVTELANDVPRLFEIMRRVTVRHIGEQDDAGLANHMATSEASLCIVGTRRHARELYRHVEKTMSNARHLSTMMHAAHRSAVIRAIKADLVGRKPTHVISTSLIEAGVDVDFSLVLRAETGLDQIAQSAGRLNREGRRDAAASLLLIFKAVAQWQPKDLAVNVMAGANQLRRFGPACLDPAAIDAYFAELYWKRGMDELDKPGVLRQCAAAARSLDFPFESIAESIRLIDSAMQPIIVADDDESRRWLDMLKDSRCTESLRTITRGLQRYTVGLPRQDMARLRDARAASAIREEVFGDQFIELTNLHIYQPDVGLDCADPYFMAARDLVV